MNYLDGTFETMTCDCCGLESKVDREGVTTTFTCDDLKRKLSEARLGITNCFTYDAAGKGIQTRRQGTDGTRGTNQFGYDFAGLQ